MVLHSKLAPATTYNTWKCIRVIFLNNKGSYVIAFKHTWMNTIKAQKSHQSIYRYPVSQRLLQIVRMFPTE